MERRTPYSTGWDAYESGLPFGSSIPPHYKRAARLRWCDGWKAARSISKKP